MSFGKTLNLGNSIIGVSILAMPYCFVQSGLVLSILLIVLSGFLTRLSCHFLLKSAFISKRRSFELMVNDVLGPAGRFMVEIGLIGFLLGTCVAYFIMIGDLAPKIIAETLDMKYNRQLRVVTILILGALVALPLCLLRRVDSLTSFSFLSMVLYLCLIFKLMFETTDKLEIDKIGPEKFAKVNYWRTSGLLTTFPIFSMAMSCQTSLFEIFDSSVISLDAIRRDNSVIKKAVYLCSFVYITIGLLGYMAFHDQKLYGNILLAFHPSLTTTLTKIGFIATLLISFPLCLFPCRTSVYSLTLGKVRKTSFQLTPIANSATTLVKMPNDIDDECLDSSSKNAHCDNDKNNNGNSNNNGSNHISTSNGLQYSENDSVATNRISMNNGTKFIQTTNQGRVYTSLLEDEENLVESLDDDSSNSDFQISHGTSSRFHISDLHFRLLTVILIAVTVGLSLMFPHIEFILGIIGSTAGTIVCFVLPAYTFIRIGVFDSKIELYLARSLLALGLSMLVFCTYSTVHNASLKTPVD